MSDLLVGALSVLLSTNQPAALSNLVTLKTGVPLAAPAVDMDPRAVELRRIMELDDAADTEIAGWLNQPRSNDPLDLSAPSPLALQARVRDRLAEVRKVYERFLERYPDYAPARNAFASFLEEIGEEDESTAQLEKARDLDPKDAPVWNNLGNQYAHSGPIGKAFPAYEKAMELNPFEPVYRYNLATVVFMYRKDAREYYHIDETAVFAKALNLYREVRRLRPNNFQYAFDFAQTFYGVNLAPAPTPAEHRAEELRLADDALSAWADALVLADNDLDREGIYLHQARWHLRAGRLDAARTNLTLVTNPAHQETRDRIAKNVEAKGK